MITIISKCEFEKIGINGAKDTLFTLARIRFQKWEESITTVATIKIKKYFHLDPHLLLKNYVQILPSVCNAISCTVTVNEIIPKIVCVYANCWI